MLSMIHITNKFTYEVLIVEGHLNFFAFEDFGWYHLSENQKSIFEFSGGLGRCRPRYYELQLSQLSKVKLYF